MNSGNSKTSDPHRLLLSLSGKIKLKRSDKYVTLSNLSIYYTWKNIKKSYKNSESKISAPTWNEEFELTVILLNTIINKIQESCIHLFPINLLVNY